jgi:cytoskeletal protein CcmA (bactofilin family)
VAKNVRKNTEKMAAVCPHCGFTQEESVLAKTTFCRKCQGHFSLERPLASEGSIVKEPGFFSRLKTYFTGPKQRNVTCFSCGHEQVLSTEAQSTMCPGCGAYVDLRDFKISGPFGRSVQTAGEVSISARGDVTSTRLMCGSVSIEGSLRGCILCTGTAALKMKGRMSGTLEAARVLIERKADVEFVRPLRTKIFELNGKAHADVVADKVVINKGGWLEGIVHAKAIVVEKGGIFSGELNISQDATGEEPAVEEGVEPAEPRQRDPQVERFDEDQELDFGER